MASTSLLPALAAIAVTLGACASTSNPPLLFGQTHTVGISIGSTGAQGGDLTLGYRDMDIAVVPVTFLDASGTVHPIRSTVQNPQTGMGENALSVLGQFEVNAAAQSPQVGLGKFFATGLAADKLADGFRAKLGGKPTPN